MKSIIILAFAIIPFIACQNAHHGNAYGDNQKVFDTNEFIANLNVLSSDSLQGRSPGTAGGNKAADFIASKFKQYGLSPAFNGQEYFQQVEIEYIHPVYTSASVTISGNNFSEKLKSYNDIMFISRQNGKSVKLDGDLVFAGYGIVAPEYNWDDYKNVDVKNKIVVCLFNHPDFNMDDYLTGNTTYYGLFHSKAEMAFRKGARAILIIFQKNGLLDFNVFQNFVSTYTFGPYSLDSKIPLLSFVTEDAFDQMIRNEKLTTRDLAEMAGKREFKPFNLSMHMNISFEQVSGKYSAPNVAGIVKGTSNPEQAFIYMAHYDHLGILKPVNGDSIYNGAIDNGSGTAGLINLARYFSTHPQKRTIIFLATTAEEMGFQGAMHYLMNPALPLDQTITGINLDMMNFLGRTDSIQLKPLTYTNAVNKVKEIVNKENVRIKSSVFDREYHNFRVESYPFALHDILIMNLAFEQIEQHHPSLKGFQLKEIIKMGGINYHTPNDEMQPWFRYDGIQQELEIAKEIGLYFANDGEKPVFDKENPFAPAKQLWISGN